MKVNNKMFVANVRTEWKLYFLSDNCPTRFWQLIVETEVEIGY